jgi:uncharacterized membrane protein
VTKYLFWHNIYSKEIVLCNNISIWNQLHVIDRIIKVYNNTSYRQVLKNPHKKTHKKNTKKTQQKTTKIKPTNNKQTNKQTNKLELVKSGKYSILYTTLGDKVCQRLAVGRWFSPSTPVSSTNKTDRHDITEIFDTDV